MYHYCTYFDKNYLVRVLALYKSLIATGDEFCLWALCFDDFSYRILSKLNLPHIRPISQPEFEKGDRQLLTVKSKRSLLDYYFTCTPSLPIFVLKQDSQIESVTYLDADLFFFSSPKPIFDELGNNSILLIEHRFSDLEKDREICGKYNVGFLTFRNNSIGHECLAWWRERCIEWCFDKIEDGKFADQKYLDVWPKKFSGVTIIQNKGANLAPWNLGNYKYSWHHNKVFVDQDELIFFHFHGFRLINRFIADPGLKLYNGTLDKIIRRYVFHPYISVLHHIAHETTGTFKDINLSRYNNRYSFPEILKKLIRKELIFITPF